MFCCHLFFCICSVGYVVVDCVSFAPTVFRLCVRALFYNMQCLVYFAIILLKNNRVVLLCLGSCCSKAVIVQCLIS